MSTITLLFPFNYSKEKKKKDLKLFSQVIAATESSIRVTINSQNENSDFKGRQRILLNGGAFNMRDWNFNQTTVSITHCSNFYDPSLTKSRPKSDGGILPNNEI